MTIPGCWSTAGSSRTRMPAPARTCCAAPSPAAASPMSCIAIVPTGGLCRSLCEGPAHGGEQAESIGTILSDVIILVPPIVEGGTDGKTSKQGRQGAGNRAISPVRAEGEGETAGVRLYAADRGERDAADGASEPLAGRERAGRGRTDWRAGRPVCGRAARCGPHLGAVAAQPGTDPGGARRGGGGGPGQPLRARGIWARGGAGLASGALAV